MVHLNGADDPWRTPNNLNLSFSFVEGEAMMMAIKDVAVSSGSACTSASLEPTTYCVRSVSKKSSRTARFDSGWASSTTEEEVDYVADLVIRNVERLREMSPLYEMHVKASISNRSSGRHTEAKISYANRESVMAYSDKVIEHYEKPRKRGHAGQRRSERRHGFGRRSRLRRRDAAADPGRPETTSSKTRSSRRSVAARAIASSSLVTEWIKGKTIDEAMAMKNSQIVEELNLPAREDSLLGAGRRRDQERHRRFPQEASRAS